MKCITSLLFATTVAGLLVLASQVRADIPPPPPSDFVETCSSQDEDLQDKDCVTCRTSRENPEQCYKQYSPKGYELFCKSGGESPWEIWCRDTMLTDRLDSGTRGGSNMSDDLDGSEHENAGSDDSDHDSGKRDDGDHDDDDESGHENRDSDDSDHDDGGSHSTCSTVVKRDDAKGLALLVCSAAAILWIRRRGLTHRR